MRKHGSVFLIVVLCLLLTACRSSKDGSWSDAPKIPENIDFYVSSACELTDAEGRTLHCANPDDFYGTIDGKAGHMTGGSPAYFEFTVPYSEYYCFNTESTCPSIMAMGGLFTELELDSPAKKIEWRLNGWSIKSEGSGATLRFHVDAGTRYVVVLNLKLDSEAKLSMGLRHTALSGLMSEPKLIIWDFEKWVKTNEMNIPIKDGTATIKFDELENEKIEIITGEKTESYSVRWEKIG